MSLVREGVDGAAVGVAIAGDPQSLSAFLQPGCAAAIWRRRIPSGIQKGLDRMDPDLLPRGRVILQPAAVSDAVRHLCDIAGMPSGPERDWVQTDVPAMTDLVSDLLTVRHLRLRLDVVTTNACRKFHVDAITSRLVCTYRGPGTQYGISTDGGDPNRVFTVPTGAPILLRGTLWPHSPPSGLLHRSPPIEGTGKARLVLVIDPVFDPDDEV